MKIWINLYEFDGKNDILADLYMKFQYSLSDISVENKIRSRLVDLLHVMAYKEQIFDCKDISVKIFENTCIILGKVLIEDTNYKKYKNFIYE